MPVYKFKDNLDVSYLPHDKTATSTKTTTTIVFEYYFEKDFSDWHLHNHGNLRLLELRDSKANSIDVNSLSIETQITIRRLCNQYLDKNKLRPFENVFPLYAYPVGFKNSQKESGCKAKIMSFKPSTA